MRFKANKSSQPKSRKFTLLVISTFFLLLGIFIGWKNIPGFLKANFILLTEARIIDALTQKNNLDTINLDISFKNLQKIENKRSEAIKKQRLISSDEDFVKAYISHNGEKYKCEVRLKGDLPDHWSGDKISLRVEMKNDSLLKGMSKFSIQDPATRVDTEEWLFLETLRKEECIAVRYDFINLIINGKKLGIYAIEEHFSKELIEANERREGVIVNFDDYYVWKKVQPHFAGNISWDSIYRSSPAKVRNKKKVLSSPSLAKQAENAINLLRIAQSESLPASRIFDAEKIGKFFAITHIWQANHGLGLDDINFYFNPITSLLEPIGFDAEPSFYPHFCLFTSGETKDTWFNYCLEDTIIASSYLNYLEMYSRNEFFLDLKKNLFQYEANIRGLLLAEFLWDDPTTIWKNAEKIFKYNPWVNLNDRIARIREELQEERHLHAYCRLIDTESNKIEVCLRNSMSYPTEVLSFSYLGEDLEPKELITEGKIRINPLTEKLYLPAHKDGTLQLKDDLKFILDLPNQNNINPNSSNFTIKSRFLGTDYTEKNSSFSIDEFPFSFSEIPLGNQKLSLHNIPYSLSENGKIISIESGTHNVDNNIFIPSGFIVIIKANTSFLFSANSTFVSQSIIHALGNDNHPINFTSQNTSELWPGILLHASQRDYSYFEHVIFKNVGGVGTGPNKNGINRNGWTMTGGVTVHNSSVNFSNCYFENFESEDALNIISSDFSLINTTFNNVVSDAFDGDFVSGNITNCSFSKISGDGVDFSGSSATLRNCSFKDISDKAVSVGESSQVKISNCKIEDVSFGIVSKDKSTTEVLENTEIKNAKIAAFAAFQKKTSFGPASIKISNSQTIGCSKLALIQEDSHGSLNGELLQTISFNSSDLYKSE